jgi:hypothetical protein
MVKDADPDGLYEDMVECPELSPMAECPETVDNVANRNVRSSKRAIKPSQRMVESNAYEQYRNMQFVDRDDVSSLSSNASESESSSE